LHRDPVDDDVETMMDLLLEVTFTPAEQHLLVASICQLRREQQDGKGRKLTSNILTMPRSKC
jgi:hypothetical protein